MTAVAIGVRRQQIQSPQAEIPLPQSERERASLGMGAVRQRGEVVKAGRRQCVVETRVWCVSETGEEKLVAICLATLAYIYPGDV